MKIGDFMKRRVIYSTPETTIQDAARLLVQYHIGSLPIVNKEYHLVGLLHIRDFVTLAMPDFVNLSENLDFIRDFGAVENVIPNSEILNKPVKEIMREPLYVVSSAGLLRAAALLQEHRLYDLPVVDEEQRLVGIASYVDIGIAVLSGWNNTEGTN